MRAVVCICVSSPPEKLTAILSTNLGGIWSLSAETGNDQALIKALCEGPKVQASLEPDPSSLSSLLFFALSPSNPEGQHLVHVSLFLLLLLLPPSLSVSLPRPGGLLDVFFLFFLPLTC